VALLINTKDFLYTEVVFEARYSSQLMILERTPANKLSKKIKNTWQVRQYAESEINYLNNNITANVFLDKIGMSMIDNINLDIFITHVKSFAPQVMSFFDIGNLHRLGFRVKCIAEKQTLEEAVNNCMSLTTAKEKHSLGEIIGCGVRFTVKSGTLLSNIVINPVQNQQIVVEPNSTTSQTRYGIMVDIDIFSEGNFSRTHIESFTSNALSYLRNNIFPFLNNMG